VIPLIAATPTPQTKALASAACAGGVILQVGYVPAILAHYRIVFGAKRTGPREKGEPIERLFVWLAFAAALAVFAAVVF